MYLALYRKYRPRTFDDVISQEHITTTLKNQIKNGAAAHAYLFTGSRGTGKTTCAKIFAAAVNCLDPKDGNPCLECESCKEILSGTATDIVEMDAASNRGVDDVRQLRDEVSYSPVSCKYRVYIIDEVHMLTTEAFNALLKTLEEPPEHIKFILATTELHKVPATIVSRCQRFEFRRVDAAKSAKRLLEVAQKEEVQLDEDAALLISRLSDGGMRDALSILDKCVSSDKRVTSEIVRDCAGVADNRYLFDFSRMIAEGDTGGCIRLLSELHKASKDMAVIIDELSGHFRDLMLCKTAPNDLDLLSCMPGDHENAKKNAELFTLGDILRCLTILRECADGIGKTRQRRTFAEMCFVKMCTGASASSGERAVSMRGEYREVQPQKEEFIPTPPEKMSRENLINLSRMREVAKEALKLGSEAEQASDKASEKPLEVVSENTREAAFEGPPIESYSEPPSSEERVYEPEAQKPTGDVREKTEEQAVGDIREEMPEESPTIPERISREEWLGAIEKCDDRFMQTLLDGSEAELDKGTLIVRSSRPLLLENVKNDMLTDLQNKLSNALGYPIVLKLEKALEEGSAEDQSEVERLLNKARSLGIEIKIS
ncbi:MAG: DNA polymerase III subunit gamma/tau [Oscillospiraceae bacterium]|nr:DNA polymerase III subunit gamma/tau [Oscillospiraceae bacterium]